MSGLDAMEMMSAEEVCEWLKNHSGKHFEDSILSAIVGMYHYALLFYVFSCIYNHRLITGYEYMI